MPPLPLNKVEPVRTSQTSRYTQNNLTGLVSFGPQSHRAQHSLPTNRSNSSKAESKRYMHQTIEEEAAEELNLLLCEQPSSPKGDKMFQGLLQDQPPV